MITICKPSKVEIFINKEKLSPAEVKAKTGCDYVINGGLYDMNTFTPCCHLKAKGVVYHTEPWTRCGLGWTGTNFGMGSEIGAWENYITCVEIVMNGAKCDLSYPSDMGGSRPRTAFGVMPDGRVWMFCQQSPSLTIEQLQNIAFDAGVRHAICLDGGGSTQGILSDGELKSTRRVENYICVWKAPEVKTLWCVQTGAFSNKQNAINLAEKMKAEGYSTMIVSKEINV